MSSDYIPRLRQELLRAGATKPSRWASTQRALRPLAAAAAVALVVVAVVLAFPRGDESPSDNVTLSYRSEPAASSSTARILRERLAVAGVRDAGVFVTAGGSVTISVPASAQADVAPLVAAGRFAIYDWERSVLGPRGNSAPGNVNLTGGQDAGRAAATTRSVAAARAARAPGGLVVRALGSDGWFALGGRPGLTNADIASAQPDVDPNTKEPIVVLELTADGQKAFSSLTRRVAHRGAASATPASGVEAAQHFGIVIDGRIVSVPFIDFRQAPDGIDGATGVQISGGLTPETAQQLAALLSAGPLAAPLEPAG